MPAAREIPEAAAGFSLIEQARNVLKDRGRYRENARHGAMYVDGHLVDVQGLLRAANRTLQAEGLPLIGNRPERWM
ncbi:MAG TPA: hypothetical protein VNL15_02015 [Dehalococcoidia bacterium]|nr:hypothetical protein [Dehalococcoidia bacterium]